MQRAERSSDPVIPVEDAGEGAARVPSRRTLSGSGVRRPSVVTPAPRFGTRSLAMPEPGRARREAGRCSGHRRLARGDRRGSLPHATGRRRGAGARLRVDWRQGTGWGPPSPGDAAPVGRRVVGDDGTVMAVGTFRCDSDRIEWERDARWPLRRRPRRRGRSGRVRKATVSIQGDTGWPADRPDRPHRTAGPVAS